MGLWRPGWCGISSSNGVILVRYQRARTEPPHSRAHIQGRPPTCPTHHTNMVQ